MGKSYRKTEKHGHGPNRCSEKQDKRKANRKLRRKIKVIISKNPYNEIYPCLREVSDVWCFNKDGKTWFGDLKKGNKKYFPHEKYEDDPLFVKIYRELKGK